MNYFKCQNCGFTTLFEAGAAAHSKDFKHAVFEAEMPQKLVKAMTPPRRTSSH